MAEQVQEVIQAFREAPAVNQVSCTSRVMCSFVLLLRKEFTDIYSTRYYVLFTALLWHSPFTCNLILRISISTQSNYQKQVIYAVYMQAFLSEARFTVFRLAVASIWIDRLFETAELRLV